MGGHVESPAPEWRGRWFQWLTILPPLLLLLFIAYLGWHSRYLADDFCTAGWMRQLGFFESQSYWRQQWSGRFSYFFITNTLHLFGPWTTRLVPSGILLLWVLASFSLVQEVQRFLRFGASVVSALMVSLSVTAATIASSPNLYQSLLWQTGALTYSLPLALVTVLAVWVLRRWRQGRSAGERAPYLAGTVALALAIGGLSETMAAVQVTLLTAAIILAGVGLRAIRGERRLFQHLLAADLAAIAALILVVTAPGNSVRQGLMEAPAPMAQVLATSLQNTYLFAARLYRHELTWVFLSFLIPLLLGLFIKDVETRVREMPNHRRRSTNWVALFIPPSLSVLLVVATMIPSQYALGSYPDGRVLVMAHYWVMIGVAIFGGMLGWILRGWLPQRRKLALELIAWLAVLALGLYLVTVFLGSNLGLLFDAQQLAQSWDQRHLQLQVVEGASAPVAAASLNHMAGLDELDKDPNYWVNRCVAMTYGLDQVVAK